MHLGVNAAIIGAKYNSFAYYFGQILPGLINKFPDLTICGGSTLPADFTSETVRWPFACGAGEGRIAQAARFGWQNWGMKNTSLNRKIDLWYSPTHHGQISAGVPQVVTVHDLIALRFPQQSRIQTYYFKHTLPKILHRAQGIIAISESTKNDILNFYGVPEEKVHVVPLGYSSNGVSRERNPSGNIILVPGAGYPHKNADSVIKAFSLLPKELQSKFRLVITGAGSQRESLLQSAGSLGIAQSCEVYSYLSASKMAEVWFNTCLVVYASLWEGFGIPPLEGMARGIPCIVSKLASLPEVCGDAVLYINPKHPEQICDSMKLVLNNRIDLPALQGKGFARVARYDWNFTVDRIVEILTMVNKLAGNNR